jgi:pimeloyl-ACP methyl ester carboxylesterase
MPTAAGFYYFAHEAEDKSRLPVILIHGAGGIHLSWPPQIRRLPNQPVFAPDLPGHGKSQGVGRHSIEAYAEDVITFMKALKLPAAVMVGYSMGGAIALTLALQHPKKTLGLGLIGTGARLHVAPDILDAVVNPNTFHPAVVMINERSFSSHGPPRLKELATQRMAETRPPVLHGDFLACDNFNVMDRLDKITAPTLILCGAEDKMTPLKFSNYLRDGIRDAELKIVDGAGHMVVLEQPDVIAGALIQFLNNLPPEVGR